MVTVHITDEFNDLQISPALRPYVVSMRFMDGRKRMFAYEDTRTVFFNSNGGQGMMDP